MLAYAVTRDGVPCMDAEQWARTAWEDAPKGLRWLMVLGWRLVLGLQLEGGRSPHTVLGWRLTRDGAGTVALGAHSRLLAAHNVVIVRGSEVIWTTVIRYRHAAARPLWGLTEPVHRILLPYALTRASERR